MYVVQTYLGDVGREAKLFVYYLYDGTDRANEKFTEMIQAELETLGDVYQDKVFVVDAEPALSRSHRSRDP